ncbi:hypothetical protein [Acinetobacter sp. ANC 4640]
MKISNLLLSCSLLWVSLSANAIEVGVGVHPQIFSGTSQQMLDLLKKYNVTSFRTDYPWSQVERTKGQYGPANSKIEDIIRLGKQNNIKPLIIYDYGNILYEAATPTNPRSKPQSQASINAFVNYVKWSTNHLKNDVSTFEIWNEWIQMAGKDNKNNALSDNSAKVYAILTLKSCKAIKAIKPSAIVIAGSTTPLDEMSNQWLLKVASYGILNCVDGISLHPYNFNYNKKLDYIPIIHSMKKLQFQLSSMNHDKPVPFYITEIGVPSVNKATYTLEDTANYFEGYMQEISKLKYVKGVWWYDFINDGSDRNNGEHNFGILNQNYSPKLIAKIFPQIIRKYDQ